MHVVVASWPHRLSYPSLHRTHHIIEGYRKKACSADCCEVTDSLSFVFAQAPASAPSTSEKPAAGLRLCRDYSD